MGHMPFVRSCSEAYFKGRDEESSFVISVQSGWSACNAWILQNIIFPLI